MTVKREFYVRHRYWTVKLLQEQSEWTATCDELPGLALRGMYRAIINAIPIEIERLVPEPGREQTHG